MLTRHAFLALPVLLAAGCVSSQQAPVSPSALRFATNLGTADQAVESAVARMEGFERLAARENAAIAFAAGTQRNVAGFTAPGVGAAEAAGHVLNAAFTAFGDYGHVLAELAAGQPGHAKASPTGAALAAEVATWLDQLRNGNGVTVSEAVRTAGLAGITALADLPETWAKRPGEEGLPTVVREAQPHIAAVSALLREMLGADAEHGVRGALRNQRLALNASHARFLNAVRNDRDTSAAERYAIFRSVSDLREGDPAQGTMSGIVTALQALEQAHTALATAGEGTEAAGKVAAFEAAVARLAEVSEATRRGN